MVHATALYPFVPSGANLLRLIDFFCGADLEKTTQPGGI
jgi:hypothetical protein